MSPSAMEQLQRMQAMIYAIDYINAALFGRVFFFGQCPLAQDPPAWLPLRAPVYIGEVVVKNGLSVVVLL